MFLTTQEVTTLFKHFDTSGDRKISYREFIETLRVSSFIGRETSARRESQLSSMCGEWCQAKVPPPSRPLLRGTKLAPTHACAPGKRPPSKSLKSSSLASACELQMATSLRRASSSTTPISTLVSPQRRTSTLSTSVCQYGACLRSPTSHPKEWKRWKKSYSRRCDRGLMELMMKAKLSAKLSDTSTSTRMVSSASMSSNKCLTPTVVCSEMERSLPCSTNTIRITQACLIMKSSQPSSP